MEFLDHSFKHNSCTTLLEISKEKELERKFFFLSSREERLSPSEQKRKEKEFILKIFFRGGGIEYTCVLEVTFCKSDVFGFLKSEKNQKNKIWLIF